MKNKLVKILLVMAVAVVALSVVVGASNYGDADGDGEITNHDTARILQHLAGWQNVEIDLDVCDVNGDGKVNVRDAARVLQYVAGWDVGLVGPEKADDNEPENREYRIISSFYKYLDNDDNWRYEYTVFNPWTGRKETVHGITTASKATVLTTAASVGDLIILEDGLVDDRLFAPINNLSVHTNSLVWIADYDEADDYMIVVPTSKIAPTDENCKKCLKDALEGYAGGFDGINYDGKDNSFATNNVKVTDKTVVTVIKHSRTSTLFNYGSIEPVDISVLANPAKDYLCYNSICVDKNNNFFTGYADYLKAYVSVEDKDPTAAEELEAKFIIIVVTGDDASALDETYNTPCTAGVGHN